MGDEGIISWDCLKAATTTARAKLDDAQRAKDVAHAAKEETFKTQAMLANRACDSPLPRNITSETSPIKDYGEVQDVELLSMNVDDEAVVQLNHHAIPFLMKRIEPVELPPHEVLVQLPGLGEVNVGYAAVRIKVDFTAQSQARVERNSTGIWVTLSNLEARMHGVQWRAEQQRWPCITTKGELKAHILGTCVRVHIAGHRKSNATSSISRLMSGVNGASRQVTLAPELVDLGRILLVVSGSRASWLYNTVLAIAKSRIQGIVEHMLVDGIESAADPVSTHMEWIPVVTLAVMQAEEEKQRGQARRSVQ